MPEFTAFKSGFKGDIVTPTDADYLQAIARWAFNAQRPAEVVAFVKDAEDVALAIRYARATALPIAIRGGGHNPAGASSSKGGLVIDLSRYLNSARVDPEKRLAFVGGGALWETVDKAAIQHGLATVGGTINHTGVGGLTLGGGYGWLSSAHGMVVDNLAQATVVTADGSILTANKTENSELFFGIRGAGSNFGVVTEFVFNLHPQRTTVYAGMLTYSPQTLEKLVEVTKAWWATAKENEAMLQLLTTGRDGKPTILVFPFFNGSEADGRSNFKSFLDIGPDADTSKEMPYEELNALLNFAVYHGQGVYFKAVAQYRPEYPPIAKAFEGVVNSSDSNFKTSITYEYFPLAKINSVHKDETAFRRDRTPAVLVAAFWKEDSEEMTERARGVVRGLARIVTADQPELDLGYSNHDAEGVMGEKDAVLGKAELVFADQYTRLQAIKKQYDPQNIFNKWFPITPAASVDLVEDRSCAKL
ncbi:hypothetical protein FPV67DRAFT_872584 [Lyophyllum atratum]|nr:hypothetical protein FPV67DRAFT_872584 [Lyophyllum atratum]